jgi:ABC-type Co2+ transport system permease subunit
MSLYNILSCNGFITESVEHVGLNFGPCAGARLVAVLLFFMNAFIRKWGGEEIGLEYNFWLGMIGGILGYLIPLTLTGNIKISFVVGLALMLVGGYLGGSLLGGSEDGDGGGYDYE